MSLLSYTELVRLVQAGVVENCPLELVNGASIDVSLSSLLLVEEWRGSVDFSHREPLALAEVDLGRDGSYVLSPQEFILASTQQIFNLPADIAMEFKLKSSAARVGLDHLSAAWADPTWHGSALTLELVNVTRYHSIRLRSGDRIGQVVFFRCESVPEDVAYARRGRYNGDKLVHGIKK